MQPQNHLQQQLCNCGNDRHVTSAPRVARESLPPTLAVCLFGFLLLVASTYAFLAAWYCQSGCAPTFPATGEGKHYLPLELFSGGGEISTLFIFPLLFFFVSASQLSPASPTPPPSFTHPASRSFVDGGGCGQVKSVLN